MQVKCLAWYLAQSKQSVNVSIVIFISASAFESSGIKTKKQKAKPLSSHEMKVSNDEYHGTTAEEGKKEIRAKGMLAYLSLTLKKEEETGSEFHQHSHQVTRVLLSS